MEWFNKILGTSWTRQHDSSERRLETKVLLINLMSILFVITSLTFSIYFLIQPSYSLAIVQVVSAVLFIFNFIYFSRSGNYSRYAYTFVTLVSLQFLFSIVLSELGSESGIIWLYFIPPLAFFLLGGKPGTIFSIGILGVASVILWTPEHPMNTLHYSLPFKVHFTIVYLLLLIILFGYDTIQTSIIKNLNESREISAKANKAKENFISKLSHQIRTPLNDIVVLGELLSNDRLTKKQKDLVETIIASTNNLVDVVNTITEDSGIEITYQKKEHIRFDLASTVSSIIELINRKAPKGFTLELPSFENIIPYLMGDPIVLKQILLYLFDTIMKAQPGEKMNVDLKVIHQRESENSVDLQFDIEVNPAIKVSIEGLSKEDKYVEPLTFPSERLDLSIVKKLIELKNGSLSYQSNDLTSKFSFSLSFEKPPVDEKIPVTEEKIVPIDKLPKAPKIKLKDSNILLVEDNQINQKIVVLSLQSLVKNIDIANDGKEALDRFGMSKYDVILMDIQMPVMNGIIATKKIREIEASTKSHTPIIAITANAMLGDRETCLSAGMDDYISKPFQLEDLVQKINLFLT